MMIWQVVGISVAIVASCALVAWFVARIGFVRVEGITPQPGRGLTRFTVASDNVVILDLGKVQTFTHANDPHRAQIVNG